MIKNESSQAQQGPTQSETASSLHVFGSRPQYLKQVTKRHANVFICTHTVNTHFPKGKSPNLPKIRTTLITGQKAETRHPTDSHLKPQTQDTNTYTFCVHRVNDRVDKVYYSHYGSL